MTRDRKGFTLVELIVVTVLGALVVGATMQVLITNQRAYTAQNAQIQGQQSTRMALDVLFNELREVSPAGGDLIAMSTDSIRVRLMRKFGVVCAVDYTGQFDIDVLKVGSWFDVGDSVFVFADNEENNDDDDEWVAASITQRDTAQTCNANSAQNLTFSGQNSLFNADSVRVGAPIRSFVKYTFGTVTYDGDVYLGRREESGTMTPIVGPLRPTGGLSFAFRDADGAVTATNTLVRQIVVRVRTGSTVLNSLGEMVSDSITAWIYTRN